MDSTAPDTETLASRCDQSPPEQAVAIAAAFTEQHPEHPFGWTLLAESHYRAGDFEAAAGAAEQAARLNPNSASAHSNLGVMLKKLKRFNEAEAALRRALQCNPDFIAAYVNLGSVLRELDRFAEAEAVCRRVITLAPGLIEPVNNLANVFKDAGRHAEAETLYRQVIARAPDNGEAYSNLGALLMEQGRPKDAEPVLRRAIALNPEDVMAHAKLAVVLAALDRTEEAEIASRRALALDPCHALAYGNLLYLLAYAARCSGEAICREARKWNRAVLDDDRRLQAERHRFHRAPAAGRPLRVGILSAELGAHVVACFLNSWLWQLNPNRIDLYLYPVKLYEDTHAIDFERRAPHWTSLVGLSDDQAAERLRADRLDILIETSGHTAGNRLGILARRVAPVQCHYIGYFASTGLSTMDYFIGDEVLIPPEHNGHFVEQIWRLPRTRYAYDPMRQTPAPSWQPDPVGRLWIGSFNNLSKVRGQSLALWARVLQALPESRLLLKDRKADDPLVQARILETLRQHGIARERVSFFSRTPSWAEHMALYNHVDIALDTIPINSATTACDALWMGSPLVTLLGEQLAGRQAASILTGLGRTEWIARDVDEFVEIVTALAHDKKHRQQIRNTQRVQMRESELGDGLSLARALQKGFEEMFARWQSC
ncbi:MULTISPECIES: O-linked N-acetylglucosamine transferase, SPINDLY family protein [Thiorhodovibrio]|uniref:O-linked N-acetylglucosamine transferase, SPINDLY family protein n=1 Tax=Thiorhodovibrio TaxID=61593 RepID=UPI001914D652|nr:MULTISPECIES: tetratricopeptide repeat protein [Thiorhodovibrio]WPL11566.1 TPR repeat-containing protein YrrB [Thiorhodovibrio litoralis]